MAHHEKFLQVDNEFDQFEDFLEQATKSDSQLSVDDEKKLTKQEFYTLTELFFEKNLSKDFYKKDPTEIALKNSLSLWPLCNMIETISFTQKSIPEKLNEINFWCSVTFA